AVTGDNWGDQVVVADEMLSGDGTASNPLGLTDNAITLDKLAGSNAQEGQVIQWNGTQWVAVTLSSTDGDDWGSQVVAIDSTLKGDGTSNNPLGIGDIVITLDDLADIDAQEGQVIQWDGSKWTTIDIHSLAGDDWGDQVVTS